MVHSRTPRVCVLLLLAASLVCGPAPAQTLYKYRGDAGEWIFADRPPADGSDAEVRSIEQRVSQGNVVVTHAFTGDAVRFTARNSYYAPVEVRMIFERIAGVDYPHPDDDLRWVVAARSDAVLLELALLGDLEVPAVRYRYEHLPGDPAVQPARNASYRVPYSVGTGFMVSQAYPDSATHVTRDSMYAVDFAMPAGTNVVAARDGIVFDVASTGFRGGFDADQYADLANLVRILHDDGTFAVYAHLNWNTIRVRPGDRVQAGQYIADSGNTGFSSGPHLHFAVQRNLGMRVESLPVRFRGPGDSIVSPIRGETLIAYR